MSLVTIQPIPDGADANSELFNTRFGALANVLNGGIDVDNLADSAVATSKIADKAVTSAKMNPSKTVDSNGWTVYNYGSWKEYEIAVAAAPNVAIGADGAYLHPNNIPLPVGVANVNQVHVQYSFRGNERIHLLSWRETNGDVTSFHFQISNVYSPATTTLSTYTIYMRLKDK